MNIVGKTVKIVRPMTNAEAEHEGWEDWREKSLVIEFTDGSKIYAASDEEGNGPGCLFGIDHEGENVYVEAI